MQKPGMIGRIVTALILVPLAIIFICFAVANRQTIVVSFDPFDSVQPAFAASMPLFVLIFVLLSLGVLIGGTAAWLRQSRWRRTARRLDADVGDLRAEMASLRRQLGEEPPRLARPYEPAPPASLRSPVE
ncbi:MAG: hypothetical protein QOD40_2860 [Alphaproteobacteria bacterium]|jgi:uncharacterized integral membrane protein|nr:hypothetical protein [Alphaproteobacteria bacterium]